MTESASSSYAPSFEQQERNDPVDATVQTALIFGAVGLIWGQLQNMFRNPPVRPATETASIAHHVLDQKYRAIRMGNLGRSATFFAATGATFTLVDRAASSVTGKDNYVNKAVAGCAAGLVMGAPRKTVRHMMALCGGLGTLIGAVEMQKEQGGSSIIANPEQFHKKVRGLSTPEDARRT